MYTRDKLSLQSILPVSMAHGHEHPNEVSLSTL